MRGFVARSGGRWSTPAKVRGAEATLTTSGAPFIHIASGGCLVAKASVKTAETFVLGRAAIAVVSCSFRRD